jgi:hypothetical protein
MSLQVTATQGNAPLNGLLLRVTVLTGAGAAGTVASHAFAMGPAAVPAFITTEAGSIAFGALLHNTTVYGAFTAAPGSVLDDNVTDGTNGLNYGTCKAVTVTPGTGPVGSSAPSRFGLAGTRYSAAVAEILPDGTLAEDASSPAPALTEDGTTVTTASFDPPSGSLLVARIASNGGPAVQRMTVSGGGLAWSPLTELHSIGYTGYAGVWAARA